MINTNSYQAKQFNLSGLNGISDQTLEMHFKLYEGYVKETNKLTDKISEFLRDGKVDQEEVPAYSELTRRLGFEYNGMVLHEYYFGNMKQGGLGSPERNSAFFRAAEKSFGGYDIWKADFVGIRGLKRPDLVKEGRKQLVGLVTKDPKLVLEEGAQVVANPNEPKPMTMLGHVTSSYWSENCGRSIAFALVAGGRARMGETLYVPMADRTIAVEVTDLVFFDKEGGRIHG